MSSRRKFSRRKRTNRKRTRLTPFNMNCENKLPLPMPSAPNQTLKVTLRNNLTCVSSGAGVINSFLQFDPSSTTSGTFNTVTQFPEWATWANLFGQVRLIQFEIRLLPVYIDDTKGDLAVPVAFGTDINPAIVAPGSYSNALDNADSQMWQPYRDYSGKAFYHSYKASQLPWASVGTPNPGFSNGVAAGCPGGIQFYGGTFPNSTAIFDVVVCGHYLLRGKA